ncbi:MAG TPA: aminomethyl-transferring glycine dehydrogenase subunit GcvPA [Candidatus Polarisedimenticolia bacterium]|nr:aminomethyl-transferring glycine dehydrogenase subunit GcvPA [Candidatus Polarisedimenticolia bacterium]
MDDASRYIPASEADRQAMLREIGLERIEDLFASIPESLRLAHPLEVPGPLSEQELQGEFAARARENRELDGRAQFLGGGAYRHFAPAVVDHLITRTEFYSSYTPYQPEISQGTLQAIFEYQTLICQLTELDISNASMYDGASALAEGLLMAERANPKGRVVLSDRLHPEYVQTARTYLSNVEVGVDAFGHRPDGTADPEAARKEIGGGASALVIQHPNFFGCLEEVETLARVAHDAGALLIVVVSEPVSLGILKGPGRQGADVVLGEGHSFGVPLSYGGPFLGFMAARAAFLRNMPGRLVGETHDVDGRRGYVLTLSTREQHIRREKATSNICTNEGLCALTAAIFLSVLGRDGLRELAVHNHARAEYARRALASVRGCSIPFGAPIFNEFVVTLPIPAAQAVRALGERGIVPGLPLSRYFPGRERDLLVCVTEVNPRSEIDRLAVELGRLA